MYTTLRDPQSKFEFVLTVFPFFSVIEEPVCMYVQKIQSLPHFLTVGWFSLRNINWSLRLADFRKEGRTFTALSVGKAWFRFSVIPSISENRFLERGLCVLT